MQQEMQKKCNLVEQHNELAYCASFAILCSLVQWNAAAVQSALARLCNFTVQRNAAVHLHIVQYFAHLCKFTAAVQQCTCPLVQFHSAVKHSSALARGPASSVTASRLCIRRAALVVCAPCQLPDLCTPIVLHQ